MSGPAQCFGEDHRRHRSGEPDQAEQDGPAGSATTTRAGGRGIRVLAPERDVAGRGDADEDHEPEDDSCHDESLRRERDQQHDARRDDRSDVRDEAAKEHDHRERRREWHAEKRR